MGRTPNTHLPALAAFLGALGGLPLSSGIALSGGSAWAQPETPPTPPTPPIVAQQPAAPETPATPNAPPRVAQQPAAPQMPEVPAPVGQQLTAPQTPPVPAPAAAPDPGVPADPGPGGTAPEPTRQAVPVDYQPAPLPGEQQAEIDLDQAEAARAERFRFDDSLVLDTGRIPFPEATDTSVAFSFRGEFQLRYRANNTLPLRPPLTQPTAINLGQNHHLYQWLRLKPQFQYRDILKIVGEIDIPRGIVVGDTTQFVGAARDANDELKWYEVHPRALYVQFLTPIGLFRVGHQTSHWGMGILANDGDHPSLFGDYRRGSIVERLLFATKPLGRDGPLAIALAGDLVYEDSRAQLLEGDRALQAVAAVRYETPRFQIGIYGVLRQQERDQESVDQFTPFTETLRVGVVDVAGGFNAPVPGADAFVFGAFEGAFIAGKTNFIRNIDLTQSGEEETIQSFGGAFRLGAVRQTGEGKDRWGDIVVQLETGYASGDADPYDGVTRRFTFSQNHNVGLVLFDHVLAWKTARSATIAQDPNVTARPSPGLQFLPSEGGVFGATYLNPTMVIRPKKWLDLKGGVVIAQTSADFVDPFQVGALGDYKNYDGGDPKAHDLGIEFDLGIDGRVNVSDSITVQMGAEGGVLFPGGALRHESGVDMPNQYVLNTKLGLQY